MDVANLRTAVLVASKLSLEMVSQERVWSERYSSIGDEYLFGIDPNHYLAEHTQRIKQNSQRVLLVADGEGRNAVWLAQNGLNVTACDISSIAIEKAKKLAKTQNVQCNFVCGDMLCEKFSNNIKQDQFDWVIGIFIQFTNAEARLKQFEIMKSLTAHGGRILLHGYTPKQLEYKTGGPSAIENLYTQALLQNSFQDWDIEELVEYEKDISEGSGHKGMSGLIGMVARKPSWHLMA
jgi:SAM-dependent methyltransferase